MREPFQGGWYECPVCGKRFRIPAETAAWTYTIKKKGRPVYICSWGCKRKTEVMNDGKLQPDEVSD